MDWQAVQVSKDERGGGYNRGGENSTLLLGRIVVHELWPNWAGTIVTFISAAAFLRELVKVRKVITDRVNRLDLLWEETCHELGLPQDSTAEEVKAFIYAKRRERFDGQPIR
jgi:hypothetical protein